MNDKSFRLGAYELAVIRPVDNTLQMPMTCPHCRLKGLIYGHIPYSPKLHTCTRCWKTFTG